MSSSFSFLLTLLLTLIALTTASSPTLTHLHSARLSAHQQMAMESSSYTDWAMAATPDYLWVGSFYVQNGSSFVYATLVQKVDRHTLVAVANVTLPDHMFLDHIIPSADNRFVYVNVMELSGREGFTTFTIDAATMSIVRTTMLPAPLSMLLGVDPANQLLLCASGGSAGVVWVTETTGQIKSSLDGGRSTGNLDSGAYDTVSGNVFIYDETAGVLFNVNRSNAIVSQVSNTENRGLIIAMDVASDGKFAHVLWIRANASDVWWYECVQYTLPGLEVDQQFQLPVGSFKLAALQVSASSGTNNYFIVDRNTGSLAELSKGRVRLFNITEPQSSSSISVESM